MNRSDSPEELTGLPRTLDPPRDLEERVVAALRRRRLVRPEWTGRYLVRWGLAAACLLSAVFGWTARSLVGTASPGPAGTRTGAAAPASEGGEFLLLLLEPAPLQTAQPLRSLVAEYRGWARELASEGRLVAAGRLESGGGYLPESSDTAAPGVAAASGFFVVRAADLAAAERIAATCPHLRYGGEISVRPIAGTAPPPSS